MRRSVFLVGLLVSQGLAAAEQITEDAMALKNGRAWKSDPIELRMSDGSSHKQVLIMEFAPGDQPDSTPKVKLLMASPATGIDGVFKVESSISTGGLRDVRLQEKDGVRTITVTRSVDGISKPDGKTKRIVERSAISFEYELKGDSLILKGFPKDTTRWGQLEFTVPQRDIEFKSTARK